MSSLLKTLNNRKIAYILSFLIPLLILLTVFAALKITPFGDNTLLYSDADSQYIDYYSFFHRFLHGNGSMFYSFSKGIGGNMLNQSMSYLFNPFYYLFYFGEYETLPTIYSIICILNTALSGTTMFIFLNGVFRKRNSYLIFSTVYALCGYAAVNNWQLHWLMSLALLPLIALGIHRIVEGKSPLLYFIVLAYTLMQGFHLGYMLCLFSVIYFFFLLGVSKPERLQSPQPLKGGRLTLRFALSSFLAGFTASFIWLPSLLSLMEGRATQIGIDDFAFVENMPFAQIGAKLFSGAHSTSELINGLPNIYCTLFVVALAVFFFFDKTQKSRKKTGYFVILMIYLLSFYIKTFSSIFNMFSVANWFNYRSSFVFSFLLILIAVEEYNRIHAFSRADIRKCLLIMLAATIIVFIQKYEFVSGGMVLVDWLMLLIMLGLTLRARKDLQKDGAQVLAAILMICISVSLYVNYYYSVKSIDDWKKDQQTYNEEIFAPAIITEALKKADMGFYRMETENPRKPTCGTDGMLFGYYGVGNFSSTERAFVTRGLNRFGINWYDMRNSYGEGIPAAMDSFLGLKYILSENDLTAEKTYNRMVGIEETAGFENPFVLQVANLSAEGFRNLDPYSMNIFEIQNTIWKYLASGEENIFTPANNISYTSHSIAETKNYVTSGDQLDVGWDDENSSNGTDSSGAERDGSGSGSEEKDAEPKDYYMEYDFIAERNEPVYIFLGGIVQKANGTVADSLRYLGTYEVGERVTGRLEMADFTTEEGFEYLCSHNSVYYENLNVLQEYSSIIRNKNITIQKDAEDKLSGNFIADKDQNLLFTIPYDKGWTLYIDNAPAKFEKAMGLFMSAPVKEGEHTWQLVYVPEGFKMACLISAGALLLFVLYMMISGRVRKRKMEAVQSDDTI